MTTTASSSCRVCASPLQPFMTFGRMPIANGFLTAAALATEYFYELAPAFCQHCATFQLSDAPAPPQLFHDRYPFFSSSSRRMGVHFQAFAKDITSRLGDRQRPFVVEIGSNDGTLLVPLQATGCRVLGVEPSGNVAQAARERGVDTVDGFFGRSLAASIRAGSGAADAIVAANVVCHIPDVHDLAAGISELLAPDGLFIFEDPYLGDVLAKCAYDQIYDEHIYLWSATSVSRAFGRHDFELVDVRAQPTHGGSMRYVLARAGSRPVAASVSALLDVEKEAGLHDPATYERFRDACEASRDGFRELLVELRGQGKRIAGYAATSKSTTVLNYCGIDESLIDFIADTTPLKHGTLTPGMHIPVRPHEAFADNPPDYAVLFAWNHAEEIFAKESAFSAGGGKWITFVPEVAILD